MRASEAVGVRPQASDCVQASDCAQAGDCVQAEAVRVQEGVVPPSTPDLPGTWYRVAGDIEESLAAGMAPLVCLHGGPGSTHNYFELLDPVAKTGRAVVSYDQLGCGNSFVDGRPELWRAETWVDELARLRDHLGLSRVHLLGQSWGGMLALTYLLDGPAVAGGQSAQSGVRSLVLSSTLSSSRLWGEEQHRMARDLPKAEVAVLLAAEGAGVFEGDDYQAALDHYMQLHCADVMPAADAPECLRRPKRSGREPYLCAWGPNELTPSGTLASWDVTARLGEIGVSALVVSGSDDLCTPRIAGALRDGIPGAEWELFEGCRHMCFADDRERYLSMLVEWLARHD